MSPFRTQLRRHGGRRKLGYEAIKTDPFKSQRPQGGPFLGASMVEFLNPNSIAEAVDWIAALRGELGPGYELMVDAHGRFDVASAIRAGRALEPYDLIWYEEPVPPESFQALREVRENTSIPICVGERLYTRYDYVPVFEQRLADYVMPDILWTGGISEIKKIAGDGRGVLRAHLTARRAGSGVDSRRRARLDHHAQPVPARVPSRVVPHLRQDHQADVRVPRRAQYGSMSRGPDSASSWTTRQRRSIWWIPGRGRRCGTGRGVA